jgi:hypothetical protein
VVLVKNVSETRPKTMTRLIATTSTKGIIEFGANNIMRYREWYKGLFIPSALSFKDLATAGADWAPLVSSKAAHMIIAIVYIVYECNLGRPLSILARWSLCPGAGGAKSFTL